MESICILHRLRYRIDMYMLLYKKYYIVKPSMYKFAARLNVANSKEQQRLAVFLKYIFKKHNKQTLVIHVPSFDNNLDVHCPFYS